MIIQIEIDEKAILSAPENAIILQNIVFEKGKYALTLTTPGVIPKQDVVIPPINVIMGSSMNEIKAKKREAKSAKKTLVKKVAKNDSK